MYNISVVYCNFDFSWLLMALYIIFKNKKVNTEGNEGVIENINIADYGTTMNTYMYIIIRGSKEIPAMIVI